MYFPFTTSPPRGAIRSPEEGTAGFNRSVSYADKVGLSKVPFKCAIILCGTLPCDWALLEKGEVQLLSATDVSNGVHIPTVHFWSPEDTDYPGQSAKVANMCRVTTRLELIHSAGHGLPTQRQQVAELAQAIHEIVAKFEIDL